MDEVAITSNFYRFAEQMVSANFTMNTHSIMQHMIRIKRVNEILGRYDKIPERHCK